MLRKTLSFWNDWWYGKELPESVSRDEYLSELTSLLDIREVVVLTGIRRSGKSTLLYQLIGHLLHSYPPSNICYINFDDSSLVPFLKEVEFLEVLYETYLEEQNPEGKVFLFFDEIQNLESWEKWVKKMYDKNDNVKFIVTGSSSSLLKKEYSSLLTGRVLLREVNPLFFTEYLDFMGVTVDKSTSYLLNNKPLIKKHLNDYMKFGGFPEVVLQGSEKIKVELLKNYFAGIIGRDVLMRYPVRDASKIENMAHYLLTNSATLVSAKKLGNVLGISPHTIQDYMKILEEVYLIQTVPFFSYSIKEQILKPKKVYCIDTGIRNSVGFTFSKDLGRTAENIVHFHLRRSGEVFYWKDQAGREVDFVVKGKNIDLIQVCWELTDKVKKRETRSLLEAMKQFNVDESTIITEDYLMDEDWDGKKIRFVPLWLWLVKTQGVGRQK